MRDTSKRHGGIRTIVYGEEKTPYELDTKNKTDARPEVSHSSKIRRCSEIWNRRR